MKILQINDSVFPYVAYIPDEIGEKPALLVQLHGAGERGNGGKELMKVTLHGFSKVVNDGNFKNAVLIMPQCPDDSTWLARIESIKRFIDEMIEKFNADTDRLYLCGLSMGGYGTWNTATAYPELFAAILPCCGGGQAWAASALTMPVWAFHGDIDPIVPVSHTLEMADRLKDNPNFKMTILEGVGHNAWDYAFTEETLNWILSHKKNM